MKFRPCIDLHLGKVKQIVGSTLNDLAPEGLKTNFTAAYPSSYYADLYRRDGLSGGHVIMLGPGNEQAAREALSAYPGGLQIGGGISTATAAYWLEQGASAVIVTSYVFQDGMVHEHRLREICSAVGKENLVLDLSCRKKGDVYYVVTDRWQKFTEVIINQETLAYFARYCSEFLIHAADVEGKCDGIAVDLVQDLGRWSSIPTTYAGGVRNMDDLRLIRELGRNRLDVTIGSSLDIFGGSGIAYAEVVAFHNSSAEAAARSTSPGASPA
ncbi:MAG: phosphoribosylformimino-5-aminoimidazole carboxamide ribotide isomerase [Deltaproteobacteria bacterium RIFOXYD12_FULL_57_12]|nr:MAG: phosphoribosylformimino-5-aminoimidazole carboxamide ribotide isomerase [Deltaproteobacteria bacterium RIFOXYD12_FULL_57_12]